MLTTVPCRVLTHTKAALDNASEKTSKLLDLRPAPALPLSLSFSVSLPLSLSLSLSDKVHQTSCCSAQELSVAALCTIHRITQSVGATGGVHKGQGRNQHQL